MTLHCIKKVCVCSLDKKEGNADCSVNFECVELLLLEKGINGVINEAPILSFTMATAVNGDLPTLLCWLWFLSDLCKKRLPGASQWPFDFVVANKKPLHQLQLPNVANLWLPHSDLSTFFIQVLPFTRWTFSYFLISHNFLCCSILIMYW